MDTVSLTLTTLAYLAVALYYLWVIAFIIGDDRSPDTTIIWLIVLLIAPVLGLVLYYFLGKNHRHEKSPLRKNMRLALERRQKVFPAAHVPYREYAQQFLRSSGDRDIETTTHLIERSNLSPVMPADEVIIYADGQEFFDRLKEQLAGAKDYVHMMYYIWEFDGLTRELTDILLAKLREGVEVRILRDAIGSMFFGKKELKELQQAGAQVAMDNTSPYLLNFRNHHKITVIDGRVSFTGGHNVGEEYIDGGKRYESWRDTSIEVTGPALLDLQDIFALRWFLKTGEDLYTSTYFPAIPIPAVSTAVQMTHSSVDYQWETIKQVYLKLILSANERVYIQSPYFVPDQSLLDALITASLSGVDVQLMMTGVPDKKLSWWAAKAYFRKPLEAGMKIFMYDAGYFHAKTLLIDEAVVSIGTTNFDMRSFNLQKENTCLIFDKQVIDEHLAVYNKDLEVCSAFTLDDFKAQSGAVRLRNGLCKIPSRLF